MMTLIISYILTFFLTTAVAAVYEYSIISIMTPIIIAITAVTFLLCNLATKKKVAGPIFLTAFILLGILLIGYLSGIGRTQSTMSFWQWVLNREDDSPIIIPYMIALLIGAGIFFGTTIYYFSNVLYRIFFLTLVSLIPCVLYVKVTAEVDNMYLILIAGASLGIHLYHRFQNTNPSSKGYITFFSYYVFIGAILLISSFIPKDNKAIYYDKFEEIFLNGDTTSELSSDYGGISDYSGNADNYNNATNRRLYTITGNGYAYLRRQYFDIYDFKENRWSSIEKPDLREYQGYFDANGRNFNLSTLQEALKKASSYDSTFTDKYNLSRLLNSANVNDRTYSLTLHSNNFNAKYFLSTSRNAKIVPTLDKGYNIMDNGAYRATEDTLPKDYSYTIIFHDQYEAYINWLNMGGSGFNSETALNMLNDAYDILDKNSDVLAEKIDAFIKQQISANQYNSYVEYNNSKIPESIKILANSITKDCTYDWQKAQKLAEYFHNGEFTYDLSYKAPDKSSEYFLLNSKTGTCSDFATAYVLLARACGLTVRYCEGYMPNPETVGYYFITESNSHAYPEVFIQNVGWIVYEPTIAAIEDDSFNLVEFIKKLRVDFGLIFTIISAILILGSLIWFIKVFIPFVREKIFRINVSHRMRRNPDEITSIYNRLLNICLSRRIKDIYPGITALELDKKLSDKGIDIKPITDYLVYLLYIKDRQIDSFYKSNNSDTILKCYKKAYKLIKKLKQ